MTNLKDNKNFVPILISIITVWTMYLLRSVICPFLFAIIIAYFFNPLVTKLNKQHKISRLCSSLTIVLILVILLIIILTILLPVIFEQLLEFGTAFEDYLKIAIDNIYPKVIGFIDAIDTRLDSNFKSLLDEKTVNARIFDFSGNILKNALTSSLNLIDIIIATIITPILIFYFLKDWLKITNTISDNLPRKITLISRKIFADINSVLLGYIGGQINVCLILASFYSITLSFSHLHFGFLIGLFAGFVTFIPYVGITLGVSISLIVGFFQWGFDIKHLMIIIIIFTIGNIVETDFLIPKLIGTKIGLHPLWVIFGLFAFTKLFGIPGLLLAVPLTAVTGVIVKSLIKIILNNE